MPELHTRGANGRCVACGEPFPCLTGLAMLEVSGHEFMQPIAHPAPVRWELLDDREARCPRCLHWWVSHGVPGEDGYDCGIPTSSMDERERGEYVICGCTFTEGNSVTPQQARIWHDGTSWPLPPWARADCGHHRRGPICPDNSQECLDCGLVFVSDG